MYKITISKVEEVKDTERNREIIESRPLTEEEFNDNYGYIRTEITDAIKQGVLPTKDIYGYVDVEVTKKVETEVLSQTVEKVDLSAVIKAINNLYRKTKK